MNDLNIGASCQLDACKLPCQEQSSGGKLSASFSAPVPQLGETKAFRTPQLHLTVEVD